jgi:preprotein translocase subunit SecE
MFKRFRKFLSDVKAELKKVTWPTKEQTVKQMGVVLAIVAITGIFLGIVDVGLSEMVKLVIG